MFKPIEVIHIFLMNGADKIAVGRLAIKNRKIYFEYANDFIKTGLKISPFQLPLQQGILACEDMTFDGLFGVFNDSLPDGWGRLLLDRKLLKLDINPRVLSPLDRLGYVGENGMGALMYQPEIEKHTELTHQDMDKIADEIIAVQDNEDDNYVDDLFMLNGSSQGARPKVMLNLHNEHWLVKFRSSVDPKDIGSIEYAYHLMAKKAGLDVMPAKLFSSKKCSGYFGCQRFDRNGNQRMHMHTLGGLIHADHRFPSLDYKDVMKVTAWLTKDIKQCEKQFRAAVFNVLSHNRDDHAKNFSFLMNVKGVWQVSPAYDLTFSSGPQGEHSTMMMGKGKSIDTSHLLQLAEIAGIKKAAAIEIIEQVQDAVSMWKRFADAAKVSNGSSQMIAKYIKV